MDRDDILKITISRQIEAIGCEFFIITATRPHPQHPEIITPLNLCRPDKNTPQTPWTLSELIRDENLKKIKSLNVQGFAIYITPQEQNSNKIHILVDDFEPGLIENFGPPNSLCQTSPRSQQAVYSLPFVHDRRLYIDVFNYLNLSFGDPKISGLRHAFRLAGFSNRKEKYRDEEGKFPFVKLLSARKTASHLLMGFVEKCASGHFPLLEEIAKLRKERNAPESPEKADEGAEKKVPAMPKKNPEVTTPIVIEVDYRGSDYSETLKAAWSGLEGKELETFVAENSKHLASPNTGYDTNPSEYIRKTAANAEEAVQNAKSQFVRPLPAPRKAYASPPERLRGAPGWNLKFREKDNPPVEEKNNDLQENLTPKF